MSSKNDEKGIRCPQTIPGVILAYILLYFQREGKTNNIEFTIDSIDRETGLIGAESGRYVLGGDAPPWLSIMIREFYDGVSVNCKVLQKEQSVDIFGIGKKIVGEFMIALNQNLEWN